MLYTLHIPSIYALCYFSLYSSIVSISITIPFTLSLFYILPCMHVLASASRVICFDVSNFPVFKLLLMTQLFLWGWFLRKGLYFLLLDFTLLIHATSNEFLRNEKIIWHLCQHFWRSIFCKEIQKFFNSHFYFFKL